RRPSLQDSMAWDERAYGREYDLDVYHIVAVNDFNMGAMENKGLNVFNTCYVLAKPSTATDHDYANVQGVVGHEYFHNWTGNRVTCRDWFQLTLKEGLTVYRDARFTADMGATLVGACAFDVADTGPPPDLPGPSCATRVCGESDGAGGTCTRCPMVESEGGACMDPPSPVGPDGPGASWACLDSAGCLEGSGLCRIWCPGEPCDMERHPDGCPQGVESCLVPAWVTDYEEACRMCCTSRRHDPTGEFACWDDAYNLCRYPGDCGMPYPLP
ncbi:MAG TPA: M1 family aminopeptidase, partial [Polyangiaceae bacterium LLY-WYZ-15_(1-7)]|nr:M1 family aminopeptidase [Polyangiaceae bacterium LLY-WYZ-15_(1-7)]